MNERGITFNIITELLKDTDRLYIVTYEGKIYRRNDTVTTRKSDYLENFTEVSVADCPVFNTTSCSDPTVPFIDIVAKEATDLKIKYESSSKNPFKTESFLLDHFINKCDLFPNNWEKVTLRDNIADIAEWVINVNKDLCIPFIPEEYKDLQDNDIFKQILVSVVTLSINDDDVNKLLAITKAVKDHCDDLKVAKESKKAEEKADES